MKLTLFLALSLVASSSALFLKAKLSPVVVQESAIKAAPVQIRQIQPVQTIRETIVQQPIQQVRTIQQQPIQSVGEVQVPVITTHDVQVLPVPVEPSVPRTQVVSVEPSGQAVHLVFKSQSSPLSVQQQHSPGERTFYETTRSEEPPHVIKHEVFKPVVQELRETIQPYRQITQEIKPVLEKVNVLVPRAQQVVRSQSAQVTQVQQQLEQPRYLPLPQVISSSFPSFPSLTQIIPRPSQLFPSSQVQQQVQQQQQQYPVQVQVPQQPQQYPIGRATLQIRELVREQPQPVLNSVVESQQTFDEQQQTEEGFD